MTPFSYTRFGTAFCTLIISLILTPQPANAQARWLTQKTKGFVSGMSGADVLEGLATAHKFKIEYANEEIKSEAAETLIHGNLNDVPLETTLRLILSGISKQDEIPWTADKTTLHIHDPRESTSITYNISRLRPLITDLDDFQYAIMNSVNAEWNDPQEAPDPESKAGAITSLTADEMTIRQELRTHMMLAEIITTLQSAVGRNSNTIAALADKKISKALEKPHALPAGEITLDELFAKAFTENDIPWFVQANQLNLETPGITVSGKVTIEGTRRPLREIVEPALTGHKLSLDIRRGVLVITTREDLDHHSDFRAYNIEKFLNTTTAEAVVARLEELEGASFSSCEIFGPVLLIDADAATHKVIAAAMAGK